MFMKSFGLLLRETVALFRKDTGGAIYFSAPLAGTFLLDLVLMAMRPALSLLTRKGNGGTKFIVAVLLPRFQDRAFTPVGLFRLYGSAGRF